MNFRLATPDDAEQVLAVYAPYCSTPITFELAAPSLGEMRQRLARTLEKYPWLVCEEGGTVRGYVYACAHRERLAYRWSVDAAVYIHPAHRGAGIGKGLYASLFKILALQGFYNAYGGITLPNPASIRLHESFGFKPVGTYRNVGYKCGAWHDVIWYELELQPHAGEPAEPKTVLALAQSEFNAALESGLSFLRK